MFLRVDVNAEPGVTLEEPEECGRFHVEIIDRGGLDTEGVAAVNEMLLRDGVGHLDDDGDAYISVVALRSLAEGRVGRGWAHDFQRMLDYAGDKGWMTPDGSEVRGHVELVAW